MSDISTLIMNEVRKSLESLSKNGVGFIDVEYTGEIQYQIDCRKFTVKVEEIDKNII